MAALTRRRKVGGLTAAIDLQISAARLGLRWMELCAGASAVIAWRSARLGTALTRPPGLLDPEFALMVTEKVAAVGEAAERASRRALRRRRPQAGAAGIAEAVRSVDSSLQPFSRRVRANVKRLSR